MFNKKTDGCKNNPENSSKSIENKHNVCRVKDCMKKFYELLREHAIEITIF